jgi:hypothetical protein
MLILDLWNTIIGYFKEKPYWTHIQPLFTLLSLYFISLVLAYQFIEWQFHFSPSISLYIRRYIFKQIRLVAVGIAALVFLLGHRAGA